MATRTTDMYTYRTSNWTSMDLTGFEVETCYPRFLPYTTKSRLPNWPILVKLYLRVPLAWRVLGAQAFMVVTPTPTPAS